MRKMLSNPGTGYIHNNIINFQQLAMTIKEIV